MCHTRQGETRRDGKENERPAFDDLHLCAGDDLNDEYSSITEESELSCLFGGKSEFQQLW